MPDRGEGLQHHLGFGDVVVDRDHDGGEAVVVNTPNEPAAEWRVPGGGTVAADNPSYPADDPVTVVVYRDDLERDYRYYSGVRPIPLRELHERGVNHYSFPDSRLEKVGEVGAHDVLLEAIEPSPYHARNFRFSDNREFVDEIRERGHPDPFPLLRVDRGLRTRFEVINGHKRIWASHVAGLDAIPCLCLYVCREEAAAAWANRHLDGYSEDERAVAEQRLERDLGAETVKAIIR